MGGREMRLKGKVAIVTGALPIKATGVNDFTGS